MNTLEDPKPTPSLARFPTSPTVNVQVIMDFTIKSSGSIELCFSKGTQELADTLSTVWHSINSKMITHLAKTVKKKDTYFF